MRTMIFLLFLVLGMDCGACGNDATAQDRDKGAQTDEPFFFIQMADPQLGFASGSKDFELETHNMEKAIAVVNRLGPDFVVITGDFVNNYDNEAQLKEFQRLLDKIDSSIPVYLVPGNHDIKKIEKEGDLKSYIERYGYDRFSFAHRGCHFIGLNSNLIKENAMPYRAVQDVWLEEELAKARDATHTFVFMHCPMFTRNIDEKETYSNFSKDDREKYLKLFRANGVDAIFAGHLHHHFDSEAQGIRIVTSGSITKPLGEGGFSGMNLIRVWPNRFTAEFIALDDFPELVVCE